MRSESETGNSRTKRYSEMKTRHSERKTQFSKKNDIFQNTNYISYPDRKIYFVFANVVRFRKIAFFVSEFHIFISEGRLILEFPVSLLKHVYASFRIQLGNVVSISECGLT